MYQALTSRSIHSIRGFTVYKVTFGEVEELVTWGSEMPPVRGLWAGPWTQWAQCLSIINALPSKEKASVEGGVIQWVLVLTGIGMKGDGVSPPARGAE